MTWIDVANVESVNCTTEQFMSAVIVWLKKPHVVNRRLCGAELKWSVRFSRTYEGVPDIAIRLQALIDSALSPRSSTHLLTQISGGTICELWNFRTKELSFPGTKVP